MQGYEIELKEITRRFGSVTAVDSVSLEVRSGEFLTLLGPSGCGKTTLLRVIAGFETPDEGSVVLGGSDVTLVPPYRRNVTTVFQHYALFPHLDVFGNVAFGLERRGERRDKIAQLVNEALAMVRLEGMEARKPAELSGGQQQRVALARALVLEPRVLLLDEPLAALDLKLRKQMQVELKRLQRRVGISFVYVTHDQEEALTMSDRIVVMNLGRIEQTGSAAEIYERPQNEFVAGFIGVSNILRGVVESVVDGFASIRIGASRILVQQSEALPDRQVRVMIRPEKIRFGSASSAQPGAMLDAKIDSGVYLGESTQWVVELNDGQRLTVVEQNDVQFESTDGRVGERVTIHWDPAAALIIPE